MQSILINDSNYGRLQALITEGEGRATERLMSVSQLGVIAAEASRALDPLPLGMRTGARATVTPGHSVPSGYKYLAYQTVCYLEYRATGWALVNALREPCPTQRGGGGRCRVEYVEISANQRDALAMRVLAARRVIVR